MAKLVSVMISLLILVQGLNIHGSDIAELDELIEHAQFHSQEYGDNFFVFVSKHYGELKAEHNQKHQEEKEDHEQLPFQHQCHSASFSVFVLHTMEGISLNTEFAQLHRQPNFLYLATYSSFEKDGPFQPPRVA